MTADSQHPSRDEVRDVLANWIRQGKGSEGELPPGIDVADWIVDRFLAWWARDVEDSLSFAELSTGRLYEELERLGGSNRSEFGDALHELAHVRDALGDLRSKLTITGDKSQ